MSHINVVDLEYILHYKWDSVQEWNKYILWKTAFKKFELQVF